MPDISKAQAVRDYLSKHRKAKPQEVAIALASEGVEVSPKYVSSVKSRTTSKKTKAKPRKSKAKKSKPSVRQAKYPRHNLERALRIPRAILEQNAGRECSEKESAAFVGVQYNRGPYASEISSAINDLVKSKGTSNVQPADVTVTTKHSRVVKGCIPQHYLVVNLLVVPGGPNVGSKGVPVGIRPGDTCKIIGFSKY